jgi:hypothetical protein
MKAPVAVLNRQPVAGLASAVSTPVSALIVTPASWPAALAAARKRQHKSWGCFGAFLGTQLQPNLSEAGRFLTD